MIDFFRCMNYNVKNQERIFYMADIDFSKVILHRILAVNTIVIDTGHSHMKRDRTTYSLALKLEGKSYYYCNNEKILSDPEHLVLISKDARYSFESLEKGRCIMIEFDADFDCDPFSFYSFPLSAKSVQEIAKNFLSLSHIWDLKKNNYILKCKSKFYKILDLASSEPESNYIPASTMVILNDAVDYIHTHYDDVHISNDYLANLSDISTVYFRKLFTKAFGISPIKYLKNIRMQKAKELLIGDSVSISDIARMTGFPNVSSFSKVFKAETGFSPTEYGRHIYKTKK